MREQTTFAHCPSRDRAVNVNQSEGKCRDQNSCGDAGCPLEKQFGQNRFAAALEMMAASIGQSIARNS